MRRVGENRVGRLLVAEHAQGDQPRSGVLRGADVGGRDAGEQGHGATLGPFWPSPRWRSRQLWTTGRVGTSRGSRHLCQRPRRGVVRSWTANPRVRSTLGEVRGDPVVDVIVVGAGPVGLWLAAELRRAAVDVLVLEKLAEPAPHTRALTILPRSLELFAMRARGTLARGGAAVAHLPFRGAPLSRPAGRSAATGRRAWCASQRGSASSAHRPRCGWPSATYGWPTRPPRRR